MSWLFMQGGTVPLNYELPDLSATFDFLHVYGQLIPWLLGIVALPVVVPVLTRLAAAVAEDLSLTFRSNQAWNEGFRTGYVGAAGESGARAGALEYSSEIKNHSTEDGWAIMKPESFELSEEQVRERIDV
jgi:hypothetical protein